MGRVADPQRYAYLPLIDRPRLRWPHGARIAVWVVPNIEFYELAPARPVWSRPVPDVLAYGSRDYGNRAGVWRVLDVMARAGVRGSVSLNAAVCDRIPEIVEACVAAGWELFSHGRSNTELLYGLDEAAVRELIAESVATISRAAGTPVRGFLAPALSSTETFLDLLPEFGITYTIDMVHDDQPTPIRVRSGRLISLPYSAEINDVRIMLYRGYTPGDWAAMVTTAFDQLYEEGAENGMVYCIPLHPFVTGHPHRIDALADVLAHITARQDVWLATGREIADWYLAHGYDEAVRFAPLPEGPG